MVRHENFRKTGITPSDVMLVDELAVAANIAIEDVVFWFDDTMGCWAAYELSTSGTQIACQSPTEGWMTP